jgi:hypothetical protein
MQLPCGAGARRRASWAIPTPRSTAGTAAQAVGVCYQPGLALMSAKNTPSSHGRGVNQLMVAGCLLPRLALGDIRHQLPAELFEPIVADGLDQDEVYFVSDFLGLLPAACDGNDLCLRQSWIVADMSQYFHSHNPGDIEVEQDHIWHPAVELLKGHISSSTDRGLESGPLHCPGKDDRLIFVIFDDQDAEFAHIDHNQSGLAPRTPPQEGQSTRSFSSSLNARPQEGQCVHARSAYPIDHFPHVSWECHVVDVLGHIAEALD